MKRLSLALMAFLMFGATITTSLAFGEGKRCRKQCKAEFRAAKQRCRLVGGEIRAGCMQEAAVSHRACVLRCQ